MAWQDTFTCTQSPPLLDRLCALLVGRGGNGLAGGQLGNFGLMWSAAGALPVPDLDGPRAVPRGIAAVTRPSNIGLLAATHPELTGVTQRLSLQWQGDVAFGTCGDHTIIATVTGRGGRRVLAGLARLFRTEQFDLLVNIGFAGALAPELHVGQVLEFTSVINEAGERHRLHGDRDRSGPTLLTVNRVVESPEQKQALRRQHEAAAVDMETYHLAHAMRRHRLPLRAIRAILDTADSAPPPAALQWVTPTGLPRTLPATVWLMAHPHQLPLMRRLKRSTRLASRALADHMEQMLVQEPV